MKKFFHIIIQRLGIQGKLTLMFIFLSTIPLLLTGIYIIRTQVNLLQDKASLDIKHHVKELKEKATLFLSRIETEMLLLPNMDETKRLVQNLQSYRRIDKLVQQDAEQEFISHLKNTSTYIKVDFLDKKGGKVFTISFHKGIPYIVAQHRLSVTPFYYYVYAVSEMRPGETQFTPSEIRHPETEKIIPVINYILPVFDQQHELAAIIVANISAEKFFEILGPSPSDTERKVLIVNGEGFYLYHSQRKKDWNRLLANQQEENIFHDYASEIADRILTSNAGTITEDPQRIIEYASIFSSGDSKTSRYIIFEDVSTTVLFSSIRSLQTLFIILIISVTGLSVMFGYWVARRFLFPIRQLILGTNIIREGNLDYQLNIQSHDEIQDLVASFNQLVVHWREKQALEDKVRETEERYSTFVQNFQGIAFHGDLNFTPIFFHGAVKAITGYTDNDFTAGRPRWDQIIHPDDLPRIYKKAEKITTNPGYSTEREYRIIRKDGQIRWISEIIQNMCDNSGELTFVQGAIYDITERKKAEEQIKKSLQEKEILLKEIYHRVKNNLAVVSGLLNMQSTFLKDKDAIAAIHETRDRIYSMSAVHSQLYHSEDYSTVDYKEYIKNLVSNIFYSSQMSGHVKLHFELEAIMLPIDKAIPCGLLLNEIVTNALKHAFPEDRKGNLRIIQRSLENKNCEIIVKDNGVGIPESFDIKKTNTLGLKLIDLMTKQIDGTLEIESKKGTEFRIRLNTEPGQVIR